MVVQILMNARDNRQGVGWSRRLEGVRERELERRQQ